MLGANSVIVGLGQGFQPVCGYNYGAGLFARVKEGYWFCVRLATCVLVALAALLWIFAPQLVEIFRSDPAVVAVGVAALHIQCCTVILNGFNMMGNMMTQTMGRTGHRLIPGPVPTRSVFGTDRTDSADDVRRARRGNGTIGVRRADIPSHYPGSCGESCMNCGEW